LIYTESSARQGTGMKKTLLGIVMAMVLLATTAGGQVPVTGVNANLQDILGTSTLITVVLKSRGSTDANCQLVDIGPDYISVLTESGHRVAYRFDAIQEIRVQGGRIEEQRYDPDASRALTEEEASTLDMALRRAAAVFDQATDNQSVRMDAAALLLLQGDDDAEVYLTGLAGSNDLETALEAILRLFVAGKDITNHGQIDMGLESGNRRIKGLAMMLAGLSENPNYEMRLRAHAEDRMAEIAVPAVRSLARMGSRTIIPILFEMLGSLNPERAEAAVDCLVILGGDDLVEQLRTRLDAAVRLERQRIIEVLFYLGAPEGEELLIEQMNSVPTLSRRAGIVLASDGNYYARTHISENLNQRYDRDARTLKCRAEMAAGVLRGGDRKSVSILQELLRSDNEDVRDLTLRYLAELGRRSALPVVRPTLQSNDLRTAIRACEATVAILDNDYRERLMDSWFRVEMRGHCDL
jgi:HEAT repeat protein